MGNRIGFPSDRPPKHNIASRALICPNMKLTTLEDVRDSLVSMSPDVTVPEEIRVRTKRALDAMLAVPRDTS